MTSRLSSLELHGYKTFANLTLFAYPSMVTAIVGPNGSGKSNIADSIRWVLGEQSFSLLRAKKTEDMIFSGSDQRARAGMASVSIAFNNEENWLPIDYNEVVLTRRAYRDGQNEYLINNQRVRLKDFHELLAQTGLGDRTYTIIGQGLVDVALSIKPDERRKLFEEAAGIGLYRTRKEETIKRLEATRRNLDRILDILAEIKPRLRSLERQAAKTAEYKRLQTDLKYNLREWYGYYWFNAQDELRSTQQLYNDQERLLQESRSKYNANQVELEKIRQLLQNQRGQLNSLHGQSAQLHTELESIGKNLAVLDERMRANTSLKNQLEIDIAELNEKIKSKKIFLTNAKEEHQQFLAEFNHVNLELNEMQDKYKKWLDQRTTLEGKLKDLRNDMMQSETAIIKLQAQKSEFLERKAELEKEIPQSEISIQNLSNECIRLEAGRKTLSEEQNRVSPMIKDLDREIKTARDKVAQLKEEEISTNKQRSDLQIEKTRLSVQLDMLKQSEQALANFSDGAKTLLNSSSKKAIQHDLAALTNHILVPQEYETAITAALGEIIDLLVIKDTRITTKTLEDLASKTQERVAVISAVDQPHKYGWSLPSTNEKIIGKANDLVDVTGDFKKTLQALLENIIIVRDRSAALELIDHLPETHRIVTLDGEVFLKNGIVFLGKVSASKKVSIPRQKLEIEEKISTKAASIETLNEAFSSIEKEINSSNQQLENLEKQKNELKVRMENLNRSNAALEIELSKREDQKKWLIEQSLNFKTRLDAAVKSIAQITESIEIKTSKIETSKVEEAEIKSGLSEISLQDIQNRLHQLEISAAVAKEIHKNSEDKIKTLENQLEDDNKTLANLNQRQGQTLAMTQTLQEEIAGLKQREDDLNDQIGDLRIEHHLPQEKLIQETEIIYNQRLKLEEDLQKENTFKERQFTQVQLDLTRKKEKLESLKERIEDDFGLVEFEYQQNVSGPTPLPFQDMVIENLPTRQELPEGISDTIRDLKNQIRRIGAINPDAQVEFGEVKERFEFLQNQVSDLESASDDLHHVITELDEIMRREFITTFRAVSSEFSKMFTCLFNGGTARLTISDETDPIASGIDIEARLPGRREQGLVLLSGGERSLTAIALVFALLKVSPTPFCVLDEVDAMLDESNVGRFVDLLKELSVETQFILITHNRNTVQAADVIYGVTMGRDTTSQVISLKLDEVDKTYIE
jgi:chromosome segregation protein